MPQAISSQQGTIQIGDMPYRTLGKTVEKVSCIGLGDFTSGSPDWKRPSEEWERLSKDDETKYSLCRSLTDVQRGQLKQLNESLQRLEVDQLDRGNFTRTSDWKTPIGSLRTAAHMKR